MNTKDIKAAVDAARTKIEKEFSRLNPYHAYVPNENSPTKAEAALVDLWDKSQGQQTKKYFKITHEDVVFVLEPYHALAEIASLIEDSEPGAVWNIELIEADPTVIEALSEFDGF